MLLPQLQRILVPVAIGTEFFIPGDVVSAMFVNGGLAVGQFPYHQLVEIDVPTKDGDGKESPQRVAQFEYLPFAASADERGVFNPAPPSPARNGMKPSARPGHYMLHPAKTDLPDGWVEQEAYNGMQLFPSGYTLLQPAAAA